MTQDANYWIRQLELEPHPEGGFFKEVYRSPLEIYGKALPIGFQSSRRLMTSIYYLLRSDQVSKFHRLKSDEIWLYHAGSSAKIILLDKQGAKQTLNIGPRIEKSEKPQILIPAGSIFAASLTTPDSFGLFSCIVSPGFEFEDFEMIERDDLIQNFPKQTELIKKYT